MAPVCFGRRYSGGSGCQAGKEKRILEGSRNISLNLTEVEYSFIMNMADQCAGKGVPDVSAAAILRATVRLLQHLEVDVSGIKTEDQLLNRLRNTIQGD